MNLIFFIIIFLLSAIGAIYNGFYAYITINGTDCSRTDGIEFHPLGCRRYSEEGLYSFNIYDKKKGIREYSIFCDGIDDSDDDSDDGDDCDGCSEIHYQTVGECYPFDETDSIVSNYGEMSEKPEPTDYFMYYFFGDKICKKSNKIYYVEVMKKETCHYSPSTGDHFTYYCDSSSDDNENIKLMKNVYNHDQNCSGEPVGTYDATNQNCTVGGGSITNLYSCDVLF